VRTSVFEVSPLASRSEDGFDVGLLKILALEEERLAGDLGERGGVQDHLGRPRSS